MELFSEIYSAYYNAISKILSCRNLSKKDLSEIISQNAFSESSLYIMPRIKDEWHLISEKNGVYNSRLKNAPSMPLTFLQKRWLKSIISDKKTALFINPETIMRLENFLKDTEPLFLKNHFFYFDRFSDGDDYSDPDYIKFFRKIHCAIKKHEILNITFTSSKGNIINHNFLPQNFEYSPKNNKFRVNAFIISKNKITESAVINISRIDDIKNTGKFFDNIRALENTPDNLKCTQPVCVEVSSERNAIERFMMEFAGYKKITEFDEKTNKCTASIWYSRPNETELLIRLLSFGPVLEIKSPDYFRKLAFERIEKQCKFFSE